MVVYFENLSIRRIYEHGDANMNQQYLKEISLAIFEMQCADCLSDVIGMEMYENGNWAMKEELVYKCKHGPGLVYCVDLNPRNPSEHCFFIKGFDDRE